MRLFKHLVISSANPSRYLVVDLCDGNTENIIPHFPQVRDFLNTALAAGGKRRFFEAAAKLLYFLEQRLSSSNHPSRVHKRAPMYAG